MPLSVKPMLWLLLALVVGLTPTSLAFAHGEAHHRAVHQRAAHADNGLTIDHAQGVMPAEGDADHDHPGVDVRLSARGENHLDSAIAAAPLALSKALVSASRVVLVATSVLPRAGPVDAPARQPRAPPI